MKVTSPIRSLGLSCALLAAAVAPASATVGLAGSPASMVHQHAIAVEEHYAFLRTPADVQRLALDGELVAVEPGSDYSLSGVSFPFARPEVRAFVLRFARDYHDSTGVPLTVTSLTRPQALQPPNAHRLSVHPAGMAVDFRVPATAPERAYLERTLLRLEQQGLLDVTREHTPAHYHVAVFATPMLAWLATRDAADARAAAQRTAARPAAGSRPLDRVATHASADSLDESRLPLFAVAMTGLLVLASLMLKAPAVARLQR